MTDDAIPPRPRAFGDAPGLAHALDASPLPTLIVSPDLVVAWCNAAAAELFGWAPHLDAQPSLAFVPPDGNREDRGDVARRLKAGEPLDGVHATLLGKARAEIDVALYARPLDDASGGHVLQVVALDGRATLITSSTRLGDDGGRERLLAAFLTAAVTATTEEDVLAELAARSSEALRAVCSFYRLTPDGRELDAIALAGADPDIDRRLRAMFASQRWRSDEGTMGQALATGRTVFRSIPTPEERAAYLASLPEERRPEMAEIDLAAIIAVPLAVRGRHVGVLSIARLGAVEPFESRDRTFAEEIAGSAALLLDRLALEAERDRDARRARVIAEFVQAATNAADQQEVLERLAQQASDVADASLAIYRLTPDGRELDAVALASRDDVADAFREMYRAQRWRSNEGMMGRAIETGRTVFRPYMDAAERTAYLDSLPADRRAAMAARDLRGIVAVPLSEPGHHVGVLTLARYGPAAVPLNDSDLAFAEDLAGHANVALGRIAVSAERERNDRMLRTIFEASPLATYLLDADGRVSLWNEAAERLFGFSAEEVVGAPPPTLPPGEVAAAGDVSSRIARGEIVRGIPARRLRKDGLELEVELYGAPVVDEHGRRVVLGTYVDVTDRNRLDRELQRTSETLRAILDASPLPVMVVDLERHTTYWNRASETFYGWTADEVLGALPPYLVPGEPDPLTPLLGRIAAGETITLDEVRRRTKTGEIVPVRIFGAPVFDRAGRVGAMLGIHEDLRARKELEAELRRTSTTLAAILDATPLAVLTVDDQMRVTFWNRAAERLYGWTAEEVLGRLPPFEPVEGDGALRATFPRARAGESVTDEIPLPTRTGQVLDIRAHTVPLRDGAGQFSGVLAVHEDVTERKQLEAQLLQAQKMETVGRLAGGVAHDFNNILTAVMGYTDLALEMTREPDVRDALETTRVAAQRAAGLTQQLLAFSRRQVLQPAVVNANEVVLGMEQILRRLIGEDVELMTSVDPGAGSIVVDRTQLEQVILNLAVNARDAMPDGGRLVIRTERARFTGSHAHLELAPGDYVMISVTDTGTGMDDETKARIFEPFFTTKETGKGTGLGLATTYGIVRQSGGHIWVYSEPGRGTTFKLYFPRVGGQPAEVAEPEAARPARRGRILFVEDEPVLRELGQRVLRRSGYDVAVAKDPADALAMVGEGVLPFDLLLTDVVMPGMTGVELARRLHAIRPGVPVLFMSGYAEDVIDADAAASRRFLAKPFAPDALLRAVDAAIGAAAVEDAGSSESR